MGSVTAPRTITTDLVSLQPPEEQDAALVAELMSVPEDAERPAAVSYTHLTLPTIYSV